MKLPISVIVLTYNEEANIAACLDSVAGWVEEIFVVDSGSTDQTLAIAKAYTPHHVHHAFVNYGRQRNWALQNLPLQTEWVLHLDADHRVSEELKNELSGLFARGFSSDIKGFLISRRTIFLGRWIKWGGHYPVYHAVLFRRGCGACEDRRYDQHVVVAGALQVLHGDIIDVIGDSLTRFVERHNRWATLEAIDQLTHRPEGNSLQASPRGNQQEKRRFQRNMFYKLPLFLRSFLFLAYRMVVKLGFLDGKEGIIFHFLQGFWFRFLVDAKIFEIQSKVRREGKSLERVIEELHQIKVE
jgi:glycosyltransferase involved in cell wall biosynthesis